MDDFISGKTRDEIRAIFEQRKEARRLERESASQSATYHLQQAIEAVHVLKKTAVGNDLRYERTILDIQEIVRQFSAGEM